MTVVRIRGKRFGERSKITNGRRAFVEGDGRSPWARSWSDLIYVHASDLGGHEILSEAQISLCRRAAAMECELEAVEGRISMGQAVDLDQYGRLAGRLCRLFELIGIRRATRPPDAFTELAKAFEGHADAPVVVDDDDGDGSDDERQPIEDAVEPTNGGSGHD